MNREEEERYSSIDVCDYVVTMEGESEVESAMATRTGGVWILLFSESFLDKDNSGLERIIRIPGFIDGGTFKEYRAYFWLPEEQLQG